MLCREWLQITLNGITRAVNKLLSVGEWKRRVLLPPSHFVDYFFPQNQRTQFVYSVATQLTTQTSEGSFFTVERRHNSAKSLTGSSLSSPHSGDISYFTNIICHSCSDKNITLLKKVDNAGRVLTETQVRLSKERGETATKRGLSCEGEETKSTKTALIESNDGSV